MHKKRNVLLIIVLAVTCLFTGCRKTINMVSLEDHWADITQMRQTSTEENDENYSGLLSGIRTGLYRQAGSLGQNEFECTDDGVYFMNVYLEVEDEMMEGVAPYLFYADHNSDTVIKLCGRPDCTHNTLECNAVFLEWDWGISYYGGHLYTTKFSYGPELLNLYRMDPDGSNRVKVLDFESISQGKYTYFDPTYVLNGVFIAPMTGLDQDTGEKSRDRYYYKLDGSMTQPELMNLSFQPKEIAGWIWNDGDSFLYDITVPSDDGATEEWRLYRWYPDTNSDELIASMPVTEESQYIIDRAYWGANNGLAHKDGKILKINYPNCDLEVLFETGISGENTARFYPDSIAVIDRRSTTSEEPDVIHFYRYNGKHLGEVILDIPNNFGGAILIGESRDRIYLGSNIMFRGLPNYYIDKSEFGTGNIELHEMQHPDLTEQERIALFSAGISE